MSEDEIKSGVNQKITSGWRQRLEAEMQRQRRAMSDLSVKAGLGHSTVRHILKLGQDTTIGTLAKLCDELSIPIAYIITGQDVIVSPSAAHAVTADQWRRKVRFIPLTTVEMAHAAGVDPSGDTLPAAPNAFSPTCRAATVTDRSMAARLTVGDVAIYDTEVPPEPGDHVIAFIAKSGRSVMRVYEPEYESGELTEARLTPTEKGYPAYVIRTPEDGRVLGTVVSGRCRFKTVS